MDSGPQGAQAAASELTSQAELTKKEIFKFVMAFQKSRVFETSFKNVFLSIFNNFFDIKMYFFFDLSRFEDFTFLLNSKLVFFVGNLRLAWREAQSEQCRDPLRQTVDDITCVIQWINVQEKFEQIFMFFRTKTIKIVSISSICSKFS